jgi:O-antigen ligase
MTRSLANLGPGVLASGIFFVTIAITPWQNWDPIVVPKFFVITLVTSFSLLCLRFDYVLLYKKKFLYEKTIFIGICFLISSFALRIQFPSERLFGINGRNVGALFFLSLFILLTTSAKLLNSENARSICCFSKISGILVSIYFLSQELGWDMASWSDVYGAPSSTLGNPNFVSSFVAIGFSITLPLLLSNHGKFHLRIAIMLISFLEFYVVIRCDSLQGLIIMFFSVLLVSTIKLLKFILGMRLNSTPLLLPTSGLILLSLTVFLWSIRDLILSQPSVQARLDFWHAAILMISDSPVWGQGFDYFGERYLQFRSSAAAIRAPGVFSDSAHNYFLDLGTFGGLPILLCFLTPFIIVAFLAAKHFKNLVTREKSNIENSIYVYGCLLAWIGFFLQSLISPINQALAYLGVVLTGLLYSSLKPSTNEKSTESLTKNAKEKHANKVKKQETSFAKISLVGTIKVLVPFLALTLTLLGSQPLIADARFRDALEQGNGENLLKITLSQPKSYSRMETAAQIFIQNDRPELALRIIRTMVRENPGNIRGWRQLFNTTSDKEERAKARINILKLDPKNPSLSTELSMVP